MPHDNVRFTFPQGPAVPGTRLDYGMRFRALKFARAAGSELSFFHATICFMTWQST